MVFDPYILSKGHKHRLPVAAKLALRIDSSYFELWNANAYCKHLNVFPAAMTAATKISSSAGTEPMCINIGLNCRESQQ